MTKKKGKIIIYGTSGAPSREAKKLCHQLYGYTDFSQRGKYRYEREGVLSEVPHFRIPLAKATVIVELGKEHEVLELLKRFKARVFCRTIELEEEDLEQMYD
jgi:nitrate reductase beta subunit